MAHVRRSNRRSGASRLRRLTGPAVAATIFVAAFGVPAGPAGATGDGDTSATTATTATTGGTAIVSHRPRGDQRTESADGSATYIVRFAEGLDPTAEAQRLRDGGVRVYDVYEHAVDAALVGVAPDQVAALRADPHVVGVEPDGLSTLADDAHTEAVQGGATWGLDRIDQRTGPSSGTYEYTATGAGVTAYVLDSGVRIDHVDFGGRAVGGAYLASRFTGQGDCNGHGTHVAGILGSNTFGVAKGVTIFPVRVFGCDGSAPTSDVISGLNYIIEDHPAGQPAVLNLSIGGAVSAAED